MYTASGSCSTRVRKRVSACRSAVSACLRSVMSTAKPCRNPRSPSVPDEYRLVLDPDETAAGRRHSVLEAAGLAVLVGDALCRNHPLAVVGVDRVFVEVGHGKPVLRAVTEQCLDLRADVERLRNRVVRSVDVRDERQLLDERAIAELCGFEAGLGVVAFARITDAGGEHGRPVDLHPADRELRREHGAVRTHRFDVDATAEQRACSLRRPICGPAGQRLPVRSAELGRHDQLGELSAEHVLFPVAERLLGGPVELEHAAEVIDRDDRVQGRVEDREGMGLARAQSRLAVRGSRRSLAAGGGGRPT